MVLAQHPDLAALVQARYGQLLSGIPALAHLELLLNHRSVRAYRSDPLPDGTLTALMAAAQSAATSSNLQTWSVIAIRDAQRKSRLAELAGGQAHIRQCPLFLVWLADLARLAQLGETHGLPYAGLDYLELFLMACIDAALAAQNAVIAGWGWERSTSGQCAINRKLWLQSWLYLVRPLRCLAYVLAMGLRRQPSNLASLRGLWCTRSSINWDRKLRLLPSTTR